MLIPLGNLPQDLAGISDGDHVVRDIFCHDAAGTDHRISPNAYAGQYPA